MGYRNGAKWVPEVVVDDLQEASILLAGDKGWPRSVNKISPTPVYSALLARLGVCYSIRREMPSWTTHTTG